MGNDLAALSERMNQFVAQKGWYANESLRPQTPKNIAVSMVLEAAEVLEQFQWQDQVKDKESLSLELADVALYLLQLAHISGIDLESAIIQKLEINSQRHWDESTVK